MELFDPAIIYLACGAPVAAHRFLRAERDTNFINRSLLAVAAWMIWPVFAVKIGLAALKKPTKDPKTPFVPQEFEDLRTDLERTFPESLTAAESLEYRNVYWRYVALRVESADPSETPRSVNFIRLFENESSPKTIACLNRADRRRLDSHIKASSDELISMAQSLGAKSASILGFAAELLFDTDTAKSISKLVFSPPSEKRSKTPDLSFIK